MEQRFLTDDELRDARTLIGWQFWAAPVVTAVLFLACAWYLASEEDVLTKVFVLGILGIFSVGLLLVRILQYKKFAADIQARVVEVVQGAPERVRLTRTGRCYLRIEGRDICTPNEYYKELQEANAAKIEFLPRSRLATRVKVIRGIGIDV